MRFRILSIILAAMGSAAVTAPSQGAATTGTIFDPNGGGYVSLGSQSFDSGTLTFDTTALTVTHSVLGAIGAGVLDSSASGNVQMAVFNFDNLIISSGATVNVAGDLGLAITSRNNITLGSTITLIGGAGTAGATTTTNGATVAGGAGAPGAEGGVRNSGVSASAPPPATAGNGGAGRLSGGEGASDSGIGLGAGSGATHDGTPASNGGGGGSYGGVGGTGQRANTTGTAGMGGNVYGNTGLDDLYGGSGGGGGLKQSSATGGGGGGGGGAVALIAEAAIYLTSTVSTRGGAGGIATGNNPTGGGGGSGGGILLAADQIDLAGTLDARGGDGGYRPSDANDRAGGSGGGGRIALYYNTLTGTAPTVGTNILVAGGATQTATTGDAGSFFQGTAPQYLNVPEPGALLLAFAGIGVLCARSRRR